MSHVVPIADELEVVGRRQKQYVTSLNFYPSMILINIVRRPLGKNS
jgi:hypothetical protein